MSQYLYSRDSKGKVRVLEITIVKLTGMDVYEIRKRTGVLNGKLTEAPAIVISAGKVKRTLLEQVELETRSAVNKKRDKGYKLLTELFPEESAPDPFNYAKIDAVLPKSKTYSNGLQQLQLALDPKGNNKYYVKGTTIPTNYWSRPWWVGRKLDGIRVAVGNTENGLSSMSRKGKCMDPAMTKIFQSKKWKSFFDKIGKDVMVDGELYVHGKSLQTLSGMCRKEEYTPDRHDELEFWIFDIADDTRTAEERALLLNSLIDHFPEEDNIKINVQVKLSSYAHIKAIHDIWVLDGFEGAICRDAIALYGFGSRDDRMIKVKEFQDDEFEIVGMKEGRRGAEDMVFCLITPDGVEFDSKPVGSKAIKVAYTADIDNLIGKMATVKFFNYTDDGAPFIGTVKCIRDYE